VFIDANAIEGFKYTGNPVIRSGTIIYPDVEVGDHFETGHNVIIRGNVKCGKYVSIGSNSVIDGNVKMQDYVKISTGCYIPPGLNFGSRIFLGPHVTFTNDAFPLKRRDEYAALSTFVDDNVSFGARSIVLPGLKIGKNCFIGAGAVVTKDVPEESLVIGFGEIKKLPKSLSGENNALSWNKF